MERAQQGCIMKQGAPMTSELERAANRARRHLVQHLLELVLLIDAQRLVPNAA